MNGKGDKPRPLSVSRREYEDNWQRAFGKAAEPRRSERRPKRRNEQYNAAEANQTQSRRLPEG